MPALVSILKIETSNFICFLNYYPQEKLPLKLQFVKTLWTATRKTPCSFEILYVYDLYQKDFFFQLHVKFSEKSENKIKRIVFGVSMKR